MPFPGHPTLAKELARHQARRQVCYPRVADSGPTDWRGRRAVWLGLQASSMRSCATRQADSRS